MAHQEFHTSELSESLCVSNDFACRKCGSPTIVFPKVISSTAEIVCARCNAFISTLSEFRLVAEPQAFAPVSVSPAPTDLKTTDLPQTI